jgi:UDP-N-acetylglucosamine 1-carboxyvinyltransferase
MIPNNITAHVEGGQIPNGKVKISGAKNAATPLLAAALISDEKVKLQNFPINLVDAQYKMDFIEKNGGVLIANNSSETIEIDTSNFTCTELENYNYPIRTTYLLVAGLLKKSGIAKIPYPGGCKIGSRGYDLHIMVWEKLGATVIEKENYIEVTAPYGLKPAKISFPISTIGGTENALITASTIDATTTISNAYISPEIENLIGFLRSMGSQIEVTGNSFIKVHGKKYLRGSIYKIIPDRIEALTWLVYGALSKGSLTIEDIPFSAMEIPLIHIKDAGIDYYQNSDNIYISPECLKNGIVQPFELACGTHPGIISDMQPFYTLLGLHAEGISRIYDYRYPERLQYCVELEKMYNNSIQWEKGKITTTGNKKPIGNNVQSTDLRGSMALILAALLAEGKSEIKNAEMALRGYNNLIEKLEKVGIKIDVRNDTTTF